VRVRRTVRFRRGKLAKDPLEVARRSSLQRGFVASEDGESLVFGPRDGVLRANESLSACLSVAGPRPRPVG
jgi:hypothetical protein